MKLAHLQFTAAALCTARAEASARGGPLMSVLRSLRPAKIHAVDPHAGSLRGLPPQEDGAGFLLAARLAHFAGTSPA